MKSYGLIILAALFLIIGCGKEKTEFSGLLKRKIHSDYMIDYEYYGDNRLKSVKNIEYGVVIVSKEYEYDLDTTWVDYINHVLVTYGFTYKHYPINADTTIGINVNSTTPADYRYYIFSGENCGVSAIHYFNAFGEGNVSDFYEYTDSYCSEKMRTFVNDTSSGYWVIQRDDKNSWETSTIPNYLQKGAFGNDIEQTFYNANGEITRSIYSEYLFNLFDYPTQMIRNNNGTIDTVYFEYY